MENVVLIIHLILALALIGVVLLQRSEGGGLGMGSSGGNGAVSGRSAATLLTRVTWFLAAAFIVTSLVLTIIAAERSSGASVLDRLGPLTAPDSGDTGEDTPLPGGSLLPPSAPAEPGTLTPSAD